ncbi:hypothetical protein [Rhodococcus rhodochrous]|uniref:hypothetical protein n=1 Tax=Rhodococcus rhodochrous TaxID=1829 RepID=UPI0017827C82|nr:hypothetical protein [Rhodococcus rhodochrous]QOH56267.1 hypothetical protein C6Y44_10030 [Rhodococcus rhodochrous]
MIGFYIFLGCFFVVLILGAWWGIKDAKSAPLKRAKENTQYCRAVRGLYRQAAHEIDEAEERREKQQRLREMQWQIDDANGETPPWRRRR